MLPAYFLRCFIPQASENFSLLHILGFILLVLRPRDRQAALHIQFNEYFSNWIHLVHILLTLIILASAAANLYAPLASTAVTIYPS